MFNSKTHHQGKYKVINTQKYIGDINNVRFLSGWERQVCSWADKNPDIVRWGSECIKIPYICPTDNQLHNYLIDFIFKYKNGEVLLVEVKPEMQTILPKSSKGKKKSTVLTEQLVFIKNKAKWISADKYAKENNCKFTIWSEKKLRSIGVIIL